MASDQLIRAHTCLEKKGADHIGFLTVVQTHITVSVHYFRTPTLSAESAACNLPDTVSPLLPDITEQLHLFAELIQTVDGCRGNVRNAQTPNADLE